MNIANPMRVGGIGTGRVFHDAHVPVYAANLDLSLVVLFDPNPAAAEQARDYYLEPRKQAFPQEKLPDVTICQSAEALLSQVELVDICNTVRYHAYYAAMALQAGVHAMTEKPFARTWWKAQHVVEAVIGLLNWAQLSELRGRASIKLSELDAWSQEVA